MSVNVIRVKDLDMYIRREDIQVIDVRTMDEFNKGHLKKASCVPYEVLSEDINKLDKSKYILLYCDRGNVSLRAARELSQKGYNVINVCGGIQNYSGLLEK